ncbi:DoxX family membrane protein [Streptomonospora salina]|uniref:Putative oxidoreductase n=1 Tax=Streptomonospora salina TaxID=104205 RepID=A0A841EH52_9ACTN|nr:DoxX family membrane protein [Streptomonospora salina]MBB6000699.1 putative oxidoreductase [Streptomonospora salina]
MDIGLLLLRLALAALLLGHAAQKSLGWFRGAGLAGSATMFHGLGFRPARPMVVLASAAETAGAALILLGLLTPLGAAAVIGTMTVAAAANAGKGLWAHHGGYEAALVYALIAAALGFTGAGAYSLDAPLGMSAPPVWAGAGAVVLGLLATAPVLLRRRAVLRGAAAAD